MIPYFLLMLAVLANLFLFKITKNKIFIKLIFTIVTLFSGLRVNVGVDYHSYVNGFYGVIKGYPSDFELGSKVIIMIIDALGYGPQVYFFVMAIITNFFMYLFIVRHSRNLVISVATYIFITLFYFASFNAIRQYAAISIALFSLRYILDRNFLKYFLCVALGALFHLSAIITLPLYFFLARKYNPVHLFFGGFITLLLMYVSLNYLAGYIFNSSYLNFANTTTSRGLVTIFIVFNIYMIFLLKDVFLDVILFKNMLFISLLLLVLVLAFPMYSMGVMRLNSFYLFAVIPLLSYIPYYHRVNLDKVIVVIPILLFSISYYLLTLISKGTAYKLTPYKTIFF
ncbi:EpsG family protein [Shewanella woodyi]|uniref:EpsG family protein n=1 Tax=Shewanella woodyi TaxID=60961 RepID=UPI0007EB3577|nr:EpsG family protein [Shewanella woodyi]